MLLTFVFLGASLVAAAIGALGPATILFALFALAGRPAARVPGGAGALARPAATAGC